MSLEAARRVRSAAPVPRAVAPSGARRILRNSLIPLVSNLAARVMALAIGVVLAYRLGPDGAGAYAFAVNLWLYASIVADFGLGTWLTREVARSPERARVALAETLGLRLLLSAAVMPVLVGVAAGYALLGAVEWAVVATVALLGLGLLPGAISAAVTALFNAHERMVFPAHVQLGSALVTVAGGTGVLLLGHGIVALGWVSLAANVLTAAVLTAACARRFFPVGASFDLRRQAALIRETVPLMANALLNNVFFRFDVQILQSKGSAVVGYYTSAYKIIDAAGALPSSFVLALFPLLSRRAAEAGEPGGASGLERVYVLALKLMLALAFPFALVVTLVADDLTRLLWGPSFLPDSALALRVLIWFLPLSFFNGLTQYVLIALGLQRRITPAFALAAAFNVAANLLLVPQYSYVAAAGITIASEVVLLVPFLLGVRAHVGIARVLRAAARPLPAAAGMALMLWLLAGRTLVGATVVGSLGYVLLLLATRVFDPAERETVLGLVPHGLRNRAAVS